MFGLKFEELTEIERTVVLDLKKIFSRDDWRKFFFKNEKGLYDFDFSDQKYPRSHFKIGGLKKLAETFHRCVEINDYQIIVKEELLISVVHSLSFGDALYGKHVGGLIVKFPEDDWLIFTALLLLEKNVVELDRVAIIHYLQCLAFGL